MTKVLTKKYFDDGRPPESIFVDSAYTVSHAEQVEAGLVKRADNYVSAKTGHQPIDTSAIQRVADSALQSTNGETDSLALASLATNIETSRPIERALASGIRVGIIFLLVVIPFAAAVFLATEYDPLMYAALVLGAILSIVWVYRNDNRHSPAGIEHGKIDGYVDIRKAEIESQERVAMKKIDAFGRIVEGVYGHNDTTT